MNSTNQQAGEYLVRDYTHVTKPEDAPMLMFVPEADIFELLDDAKRNNKKITVHEVGRCIIDWK